MEACSTHTAGLGFEKPALIDFKDWLQGRAEGHEPRKMSITRTFRITAVHRMLPKRNPAKIFLDRFSNLVNEVIQLTKTTQRSVPRQIVWSAKPNIFF